MRPKVTFRPGGRLAKEEHPSERAGWLAEYARPEDRSLPRALQDILQTWRLIFEERRTTPTRKDIRATLQALARISDAEAQRAVHALDANTAAELDAAALTVYLSKQKKPAQVPTRLFDQRAWTASQIRAFAAVALRAFARSESTGGRPRTRQRDIEFARVLLAYWRHTSRRRLTLTRDADTPFFKFARNMFRRVGRNAADASLFRILIAARKNSGPG